MCNFLHFSATLRNIKNMTHSEHVLFKQITYDIMIKLI